MNDEYLSEDEMEEYIVDSFCELREELENKFNIRIWLGDDWEWEIEE